MLFKFRMLRERRLLAQRGSHFSILLLCIAVGLTACSRRSESPQPAMSTIRERDTNADGSIDLRTRVIRRGETVIFHETLRTNGTGGWSGSRSFHVGGELIMIESDEDGDGLFETLVVYGRSADDLEVFTRKPDGTLEPATVDYLLAHKKVNAVLREFWEHAFDGSEESQRVRLREFETTMQETVRELKRLQTETGSPTNRP